jgi:hypothetical protein
MSRKTSEYAKLDEDQPIRKTTTNAKFWYCVYGLNTFCLSALCLAFWIVAKEHKVLYPYEITAWFRDNPKIFTIIWTLIATLLSLYTSFLLKAILNLMMRQKVRKGASLASIESLYSSTTWKSRTDTTQYGADYQQPRRSSIAKDSGRRH